MYQRFVFTSKSNNSFLKRLELPKHACMAPPSFEEPKDCNRIAVCLIGLTTFSSVGISGARDFSVLNVEIDGIVITNKFVTGPIEQEEENSEKNVL
jgi:hypothetical protein